MYYLSLSAARTIRQKGFLIPLKKEIDYKGCPQDFYKSASGSFLLESCRYNVNTGRFSFVGAEPFLTFKSKRDNISIISKGSQESFRADPVKTLRSLFYKYRSVKLPGINGFTGGAVGYFSYDCRHLFEDLPAAAHDDLGMFDIFLMFVDTLAVFDHVKNKVSIISNIYPDEPFEKAYNKAAERIERMESSLRGAPTKPERRSNLSLSDGVNFHSTFTKDGFEEVVRRAKEHIAAGDIYQANLSQRFCFDIHGIDAFELYKNLSRINPSPFACFMDLGDFKIASSSPERLVKLEGDLVETRPIAGTRPRGKTVSEDASLSCELILSDKERAEHIMLVDLERNDLGRVCRYGSVRVNELMVIEPYSHVMHIVSNVFGRLRPEADRFDLLAAVFPGGTITGCPKIRCMQIIDELEPVARNIYTGSVGYMDFNGDMDLNIAIRTFAIKDGKAYIQVGSGIVADSDPEKEYYETIYKAEALFEAINVGKMQHI